MSKRFTKIICGALTVIAGLTTAFSVGCSNYYSSPALSGEGVFTEDAAQSNGGFAVKKGNYVYFINGVETNTAPNSYGKPIKGAVYRISSNDLKERNYNKAEKVVKQIAYTSDYNSGIYVYGDYIYYATPSTARNSEGEPQNTNLELKSTKLDGTQTLKTPYVQFPSLSYEFRFVEAGEGENKAVYILYVATSETLYEESTGVTNLHSYNTKTGEDTLLAYNVGSVIFDSENVENPRVYYTMGVRNYSANTDAGYNQLYTVTADATEDKFKDKLSKDTVPGWDDEMDRYINCGDLVLDGIGQKNVNGYDKVPMNYKPEDNSAVNLSSYTYTLKNYQDGALFYTRTTPTNSAPALFTYSENAEKKNPVDGNPDSGDCLMLNGEKANEYKYIFDNKDFKGVLIAEGEDAGISINLVNEGKLQNVKNRNYYYNLIKEGTATLLSIDTQNKWLYYSLSGGNGYSVNRINYSGENINYEPLPAEDTDYTAVKILDIDASSDWFKPEIIDNYLLFASETSNMTNDLNYVMVFDMNKDGGVMSNADIRALNEQYEGIEKIIKEVYGDTDKYPAKTYANLQQAIRYAHFNGDYKYLQDLAAAANEKVDEDGDPVYSEQTLTEYEAFLAPAKDGVWEDYTDSKTVNGEKVYANMRDYYYCVLGEMTEDDQTKYLDGLKSSYLTSWPEDEDTGWYEGLSTGAKAGFIVGVCAGGLLVIAGVTVLTVWLVRRKKKAMPGMTKKRVKVDTTDDKDIDVYSQE